MQSQNIKAFCGNVFDTTWEFYSILREFFAMESVSPHHRFNRKYLNQSFCTSKWICYSTYFEGFFEIQSVSPHHRFNGRPQNAFDS